MLRGEKKVKKIRKESRIVGERKEETRSRLCEDGNVE